MEKVEKVLTKIFSDEKLLNEFLNLKEEEIYNFCLENSDEKFTEDELKYYGYKFFEKVYSSMNVKEVPEQSLASVSGGMSNFKDFKVRALSAVAAIVSCVGPAANAQANSVYSSSSAQTKSHLNFNLKDLKLKLNNLDEKTKKALIGTGVFAGAGGLTLLGGGTIWGLWRYFNRDKDSGSEGEKQYKKL